MPEISIIAYSFIENSNFSGASELNEFYGGECRLNDDKIRQNYGSCSVRWHRRVERRLSYLHNGTPSYERRLSEKRISFCVNFDSEGVENIQMSCEV